MQDRQTQIEIENLKVESMEYFYKLNVIVGIGALMAAIACLGTRHPSINALLVLICAVSLTKRMDLYYPKTARAVRDLLKQHPNDAELIELNRSYTTRIVSFRNAGLSLVPYFLGTMYFTFVLFIELIPFIDRGAPVFVNWYLGR